MQNGNKMNSKKRLELFTRFKAHNPNPTTELIYNSEFELLIAVILSAQATDIGVNKATKELFKLANTPEKILGLGEEKLKSFIKSINFYPTKAKNILKTCEMLIKEHHSKVPQTREALEKLAGVGRKTANVLLNTAFHQETMAVDTHIFRVSNRLGLTQGNTPRAVEDQLLKVVPKSHLKDAHHWLILHGRYVCVARKPKCWMCIVADLCEYPNKILKP